MAVTGKAGIGRPAYRGIALLAASSHATRFVHLAIQCGHVTLIVERHSISVSGARSMVHFSLFPTPLGDCAIAWRGDAVVATQLPERTPAATAARLAARTGGSEGEPPPVIRRAMASMTALLEGAGTDLTYVTCDFSRVRPFEAEVYALTRAIPAGETLTYGAIALQLGDRRLAQNVGRALGRNPLPIIVPCHRVVGANGKLTGFSAHGGVETKLRMLAIEGAQIGEGPGLFSDLPPPAKPQG